MRFPNHDVSMFGFRSSNAIDRAAYDLCILDEIEKDDHEIELRHMYPDIEREEFND